MSNSFYMSEKSLLCHPLNLSFLRKISCFLRPLVLYVTCESFLTVDLLSVHTPDKWGWS